MGNCNPCAHCGKRMASTSVTEDGTNVIIAAALEGPLQAECKYCLILAQPVPLAGYNLPVILQVTASDGTFTEPLKRLYTDCGVCNVEFGEDLPKCRNRIPLYHTNGQDFIDLRGAENRCYCR